MGDAERQYAIDSCSLVSETDPGKKPRRATATRAINRTTARRTRYSVAPCARKGPICRPTSAAHRTCGALFRCVRFVVETTNGPLVLRDESVGKVARTERLDDASSSAPLEPQLESDKWPTRPSGRVGRAVAASDSIAPCPFLSTSSIAKRITHQSKQISVQRSEILFPPFCSTTSLPPTIFPITCEPMPCFFAISITFGASPFGQTTHMPTPALNVL